MTKNRRVPSHTIEYGNERSSEKKTTKFRFNSSNGFVFVTALIVIAVIIILVTAMAGYTVSAE